jgi:hypothetical protein
MTVGTQVLGAAHGEMRIADEVEFDVRLVGQHAPHSFDDDQLVIDQQDTDLERGNANFGRRASSRVNFRHLLHFMFVQALAVSFAPQ